MTIEEAVKLLQATRLMLMDGANQPISDLYYALDMAIEALEQAEPDHFVDVNKMADNWRQLRETISELAAWKGGGTQEDVCGYLLRYMEILDEECNDTE